jgi:predicted metalloprotease
MNRQHLRGVTVAIGAVLLLASCTTTLSGKPVSVYDDPFRVAGMPAVDGPTGLRPDHPAPIRKAERSDGGELDTVSLLAIDDVEEFWRQHYPEVTKEGTFTPAKKLISYDSTNPDEEDICGYSPYEDQNAFYTDECKLIAWDRGVFVPDVHRYFGDVSIFGLFAHEYGHSVQGQAGLVNDGSSVLLGEQQADCFEGAYMRWAAEGNSRRFTVDTADGLNKEMASVIGVRDRVRREGDYEDFVHQYGEHGSAFERISAWQFGFTDGPTACAAIDEKEIKHRRGDLPLALQVGETGQLAVDEQSVRDVVDVLGIVFKPAHPPQLSLDPKRACPDARPSPATSYCPATNTVTVDLPALQKLAAVAEGHISGRVSGDNTAFSMLTSRYTLAVQQEYGGLALNSARAALRTACLTGVATTAMSWPITLPNTHTIRLSAGDLDEAVAGLLINGMVASDVNGDTVPSGFSRVDALRTGVLGDKYRCMERFR